MCLGLLDPDPDPLVRSRIPLSSSKNNKKNLDSYCFVTSFGLLIFEKLLKCTFKKKEAGKPFKKKIAFCWSLESQ
jgi:hypothetical protein